ncbi:hypothetical protein DZS_25930 [Dickeya ananatis]
MLWVLGSFCVLWIAVSLYTMYSFKTMNETSKTSALLVNNMNLVNTGNDQYFRMVTRLARAIDYRQSGDDQKADEQQKSSQAALDLLKSNLEAFKKIDHAGMSPELVDAVTRDWSNLITQGVEPMFQRAVDKKIRGVRQVCQRHRARLQSPVQCLVHQLQQSRVNDVRRCR